MKKKYLKWIGVCAVLCIAVLAFMGAAKNPDIQKIENLLEKRTNVMENVLLGKITYDEGKAKLKEIEEGTLYDKDMVNLIRYRNTDIDPVKDMEILRMAKEGDIYDIMTFEGEIRWAYQGTDEMYYETNVYQIGVSEKNDVYKLISLEIQENQ